MDRVKILVTYALEDALAAGEPSYGQSCYLPTAAELAALPPDARAALACWVEGAPGARPLRVGSPRPSWEDVHKAVEREVEAERERREAAVLRVLEYPALHDAEGSLPYLGAALDELDPRIRARIEAEAPMREKLRAEARARREVERERVEAVAKKHEARAQSILDWAKGPAAPPALRRAAEEGYAVGAAVMKHVVEELVRNVRLEPLRVLVEGRPDYDGASWEERSAPDERAFHRLDWVRAAVRQLGREGQRPEGVEVEVLKIMRFLASEIADPVTAILVRVAGPGKLKDRILVFNAEVDAQVQGEEARS